MNDVHLIALVKFLSDSKYYSIVIPGHINDSILNEIPDARAISYVVSCQRLEDVDAFIVHKGLMHRIDPDALLEIYFNWSCVFANDVFCIFARQSKGNVDTTSHSAHLAPVTSFVSKLHQKHNTVGIPKSAVIVSAFGVQNVGDDLVSISSERMLRDVGIEQITKSGPNVSLDDIEHHDLIVLGGGGLLYDSDPENLENYLYPLRTASRLGKKTAVLGVGTQGLHSTIGRESTAGILRNVDFISVRSPLDKEVIEGLDGSIDLEVVDGQDMGFYAAGELRAHAIAVKVRRKLALFSISITIRERLAALGLDFERICSEILNRLIQDGYEVNLALHSLDDERYYYSLAEMHNLRILDLARLGIYGTASVYSRSDLVVTSRFHAIIYAAIFGRRVVSLYGDRCKSGRLLKSYLPSILRQSEEIEDFDLDRLMAKIDQATSPDPSEVKSCEEAAMVMKDRLAAAIMV
jgi:polysaccharide pyruvyl transferase WcaK-like protein